MRTHDPNQLVVVAALAEAVPEDFLLDTLVSSFRKDDVHRPPRWKAAADAWWSRSAAPDADREEQERSLDRSLERWSVESYSSLEKPESEEKALVLGAVWSSPWPCGVEVADVADAEHDDVVD